MNMFLSDEKVFELLEKYGSPLYVYDEGILRTRCRELKNLLPALDFRISYSAKANSNLTFLKIVESEGLEVDAMSPGEIFMEMEAGFSPDRIFYIGNNVSEEELRFAVERGVLVSVDSLSQLELFGRVCSGGEVAVRMNPGVGAGHHEKVVTAGKKTKFGVQPEFVPQIKEIVKKYNLRLKGLNQHIGSLFLDGSKYVAGVKSLLAIAKQFPGLSFIDMGGGFGVPYREEEPRLDLAALSKELTEVLQAFLKEYDNKQLVFKAEPGRYISAECGILLSGINTIKENYGHTYVGTDIGMNVLMRPVLYDSYHAMRVVSRDGKRGESKSVTVVGNICESGDILAKDRLLPEAKEGDAIAVLNAGAYGMSMSSAYNNRLRPAEVLLAEDGSDRLIRRRDTLEDLLRPYC